MENNGIVIEAQNIVRHYTLGKAVVQALRGITVQIQQGEFLSVVGPSGSGKSTLMHLMGCLDTPTSGRLYIDGEDVSEMDEEELAEIRNRKIGFVFQQFNLLSRISILDNVMTPLVYQRVRPAERRQRAVEALERVGLGDRLKHRPAELSGGQRQRVAIARALVTRPSMVLADEPTGALDSETGRSIMKLFGEINDEEGKTIVVVTHDREVSAVSRRSIVLKDGLLEVDHAA
jgi:putative ABC transport system ATP-binding protein